ncbi:MAG: hypothetical protein ACQEQI_01240 [Bacillota bacterium]
MSRRGKLLLVGVAVLVLLTGCTQQNEIAVVDMQQVVEESKTIQNYQQQLDEKLKDLQSQYETDLDEIDDEDKLESKRQEAYQQSQQIKSEIESQVKSEIQSAIKEVAKQEEIDIVLNKENVRYGGEEITKQVLETLAE